MVVPGVGVGVQASDWLHQGRSRGTCLKMQACGVFDSCATCA